MDNLKGLNYETDRKYLCYCTQEDGNKSSLIGQNSELQVAKYFNDLAKMQYVDLRKAGSSIIELLLHFKNDVD